MLNKLRKAIDDKGCFPPIGNRGFLKARGSGFGNEECFIPALFKYQIDYLVIQLDFLMNVAYSLVRTKKPGLSSRSKTGGQNNG